MVKVERSTPAPESLAVEKTKADGKYDKPDVVERLKKDFNNKCYICEINDLQDPQIEHLKPHSVGRNIEQKLELKFDWNNLFWSCGHCNGIKNQRKYDEHIIDCCKADPEDRIYFRLCDGKTEIIAKNMDDYDAKMTAELVYEVFNKKNTGMRIYRSDMRFHELNKKMNKLFDTLDELTVAPSSAFAHRKLQALIRRESRFAAFKRCYIRENAAEYVKYL